MNPVTMIGVAFVAIVSITSHEAAHGFVADRLGDPTARDQGRLTLNPIRHIDLFFHDLAAALSHPVSLGIHLRWGEAGSSGCQAAQTSTARLGARRGSRARNERDNRHRSDRHSMGVDACRPCQPIIQIDGDPGDRNLSERAPRGLQSRTDPATRRIASHAVLPLRRNPRSLSPD